MPPPTPNWPPTASPENLKRRSEMTMAIHDFFQSRGFLHVETPILSHDTVVDRTIEPVTIAKNAVTGRGADATTPMFMQTSPEFAMKRLVCGGMERIYQIARVFRHGEQGARHNPEFTMLEWYRVGDDMAAGMQLLSEFTSVLLGRPAADCIAWRKACKNVAGLDPLSVNLHELINVCRNWHSGQGRGAFTDVLRGAEDDADFWMQYLFSQLVEPQLGLDRPAIVYDWPAAQSALAIVRDEVPPVAERFELFVDGVELANGYHELTDADELQRRNHAVNQQRVADGNATLPVDSQLVNAMRQGMPSCSGVAVGVDRLLMVATGSERIEDVIAFPLDRS